VLVAGVLWLASGGALQKQYNLYLAIADESVAGLNLQAPVKYSGVDVGKVQGSGSMAELSATDSPLIRKFFDGPRGRAPSKPK